MHLPSLLVTEPLASPPPERVRVRRLPELATYDREPGCSPLLDRASLCHVGLVVDDQPFVIPTLYARVGDELLLHGSVASRLVRHVRTGDADLRDGDRGRRPGAGTLGVRDLDELPVGRGARPRTRGDRRRRTPGARCGPISEAVLPGRWDDVRPPNDDRAAPDHGRRGRHRASAPPRSRPGTPRTPRTSWSCRSGPAGCRCAGSAGAPEPSPDLRGGVEVPDYLRTWVDRPRLSAADRSRPSPEPGTTRPRRATTPAAVERIGIGR